MLDRIGSHVTNRTIKLASTPQVSLPQPFLQFWMHPEQQDGALAFKVFNNI
jgi:hypothetical protein